MNKLQLQISRFESSKQKFILSCDKIRPKKIISLSSLQRVLQINSKTTLLNDIVLTFKIKGSNQNISIRYIKESVSIAPYFEICTSTSRDVYISICALNTKELMYKINHVYKLTKN